MEIGAFMMAVVPERQAEAARLIDVFGEVTGFAPMVWGGGIVGFGRYDYRYASGHAGASLATGFAPRKADLVLYGLGLDEGLLAGLGKHRRGKACVYLKRLEGVNMAALRDLIRAGVEDLAPRWTILPA